MPDVPAQLIMTFKSQKDWEKWLAKNHDKSNGIWIKFYKKDSGLQTFNYDEALDEALCYGWIDGQAKKFDTQAYLQKFTPRRSRSMWSKRNTGLVADLIKLGKMKHSGFAEIERAKADGRWATALAAAPRARQTMPDFMAKALNKSGLTEKYNERPPYQRNDYILWINDAKQDVTRQKRIEQMLDELKKGDVYMKMAWKRKK